MRDKVVLAPPYRHLHRIEYADIHATHSRQQQKLCFLSLGVQRVCWNAVEISHLVFGREHERKNNHHHSPRAPDASSLRHPIMQPTPRPPLYQRLAPTNSHRTQQYYVLCIDYSSTSETSRPGITSSFYHDNTKRQTDRFNAVTMMVNGRQIHEPSFQTIVLGTSKVKRLSLIHI